MRQLYLLALLTRNAGAHAFRPLYLLLYYCFTKLSNGVHAIRQLYILHAIRQLYMRLGRRARRAAAFLTPIICLQARAQRATALLTRMPAVDAM